MKRIVPLAALALAAACAGGPPPEGTSTRTIYTNTHNTNSVPVSGASDVMTTSATGLTATTTMSVDSTMRALAAAYGIMHIPVTLVDPATRRVGNQRLPLRYNLNGEPLSRFVNCGETMTAVRADREQIFLSIISVIKPQATGGNVVETTVQAIAVDRTSGNSNGMIPCSTTGTLEGRVHRMALNAR